MWDVLGVGLMRRNLRTVLNLELCECSRTLGRGWNRPELGWAAEMDVVGEQQLEQMKSGSSS